MWWGWPCRRDAAIRLPTEQCGGMVANGAHGAWIAPAPQPRYRVMSCQERSSDKPSRWVTSCAFVAVNGGTRTAYSWRLSG